MASLADDIHQLSSYELVTRGLETALQYDNLSDAEKSRARKQRVRRHRTRTTRWRACIKGLRNLDMFWVLTALSTTTFVLIALTLLYYRHTYQQFLHRFSAEELHSRIHHLGFDHIYILERPIHKDAEAHRTRWAAVAKKLEIEYESWAVQAPNAVDPMQVMLHQRECWRPHLAIYKDMEEKGYMDALIIEDHVVAGPSVQLKIYSALREVPPDWDVLQLGPSQNGTDSGHHGDIPIHGTQLTYRRVDEGSCNNLAYAISRSAVRKVLKVVASTHAHADFEHKMLELLDRVKLLLFRVSPSIFAWQDENKEI